MKVNSKSKIIILVALLCLISIVNLYNAKYLNEFYKFYYLKQLIWFLCGFGIIFLLQKVNKNSLFKMSKFLYLITNIILLYLLLFGEKINGTKAWLSFGPISIQPSEFMKVFLALYLIQIITSKEKKKKKLWKIILYTLIPSILVFLEPDTGAIIFYLILLFCNLIFLKIKWQYFFSFFLFGLAATGLFAFLYSFQQDLLIKLIGTSFFYRVERLLAFDLGNYQLSLSLISIFSSGIIRNGFKGITIYIPEGATDFIFSFCVGNFGLIIALIIFIIYGLLIKNLLNLANSQNKKTNYLVISFTFMLLIQATINIMMNMGLIPIIGITLPFLSYGGSSTIVYFIFLGLILSNNKN